MNSPIVEIDFTDWQQAHPRPEWTAAVSALWPKVTPENFRTLGDFAGLRQEFMQLNGFELPGVDYGAPVNVASLTELTP